MNFIVENWYIILALAAVLGVAVWYAYRYFNLPSEAQLAKVREWLLWAVTGAEKELGGGTGRLKLRSRPGCCGPAPSFPAPPAGRQSGRQTYGSPGSCRPASREGQGRR